MVDEMLIFNQHLFVYEAYILFIFLNNIFSTKQKIRTRKLENIIVERIVVGMIVSLVSVESFILYRLDSYLVIVTQIFIFGYLAYFILLQICIMISSRTESDQFKEKP